MASAVVQQLLERIPDANEVRDRLAENLREAAVLRSLLRVAKKKNEAEQQNREREEDKNA